MASISMCMIVKNEASVLSRCLDSYAGTYDELIIVDTGSTDETKSIAAKYTDKIYDFEWIYDFAAARNYAFSLAGCDYIFSCDADEELDEKNRKALIDLKNVILPEIDIVQMYYVNASPHNMVYNFNKELRPKLFKRLRSFTWISPIHETVSLTPVIFDSDIEIMHKPTGNHSKRDFDTFVNAVNRGVRLEDYVLIMFCKELFISGTDEDFLRMEDIFENVFSREERNEDCRQNINCVLARIYRLKEDKDSFFKICLKEVSTRPCAEICMELGRYYAGLKDYEEAIIWFMNAATETPSIIDIHSGGDAPLYAISECYDKLYREAYDNDDYDNAAVFMEYSKDYLNKAKGWNGPEVND